ncbi:MAG TPA: phosphate ABC transporter substrate-binding protein PstS [Xanthomonadaceae bacterium]|nr:phosphate ABC transporter substrate-binding protein PstS [Xanthomonadaceae bacterium]
MFKSIKVRAASLAISAVLSVGAHATNITGAGSSFVNPVLSKWSAAFHDKTGNEVNYQSIGSGGGIAQIKAATVDFGASDAPLKDEDLKQFGLGQFPVVIGGIVPVVDIAGIKPGQLKLTGSVLAEIYLGNIKMWNDPAITKLNPGVTLPATQITVVHRADGSGTSFNFSNYLSKVSPGWQTKVGFSTTPTWPAGIGGKGNDGVAASVRQQSNAIGYVEFAYALQNHMSFVEMQNAAGKWVEPAASSFAAAASTADWKNAKDFNLIMTNAPGADAWPITATTWVIMYKTPKNAANSKTAFDFFKWSIEQGQPQAEQLAYVPLPKALVGQIEAYWKSDFKN